MIPPPPSTSTPALTAGKVKGIFSNTYCEDLAELLQVKLTKLWVSRKDWVPLESGVFNPLRCLHWGSCDLPVAVKGFLLQYCTHGSFCLWAFALENPNSRYLPVSPTLGGQRFALWPLFSHPVQLFTCWDEWQFLNSLPMELETRISQITLSLCLVPFHDTVTLSGG